MQKRKNKIFLAYDTKIRYLRDEYYKNIKFMNDDSNSEIMYYIEQGVPVLIGWIILFLFSFSFKALMIMIVVMSLFNFFINLYLNIVGKNKRNRYLEEIRKFGFFSIAAFEEYLKKNITGPEGIYSNKLAELVNDNEIGEHTDVLRTKGGEKYYIWADGNNIYLLSQSLNRMPEVIKLRSVDIRYYRVDFNRQMTVLKTDIQEFFFDVEADSILKKYIEEKSFLNMNYLNVEDYVNDFERFMHNYRKKIEMNREYDLHLKNGYFANTVMIVILMFLMVLGINFLDHYKVLFSLMILGLCYFFNKNVKNVLSINLKSEMSDKDYIKYLSEDIECVNRFRELKISLLIPSTAQVIYNTEGMPYLVWVSNGYFHVFLDVIYFNVLYMSVKVNDVLYFKEEKSGTTVKLKEHTLEFRKDAGNVLMSILPNKDQKWIDSIKK